MPTPGAVRIVLVLAVVLVAGLTALVYASYRRDIDRAFERISIGSEMVQTRCGPIEYATVGDGDPVLVVHGAGGGFDQPGDPADARTVPGSV